MASRWQKCLAIWSLAFVFALGGCGGEDTQDDSNQCEPGDEDCPEEGPAETSDCDPDELDTPDYEQCLCEAGEDEFCSPQQEGCQSDSDCTGNLNYCYTEGDGRNTCESRNFICTLLNCAGDRGVCDPDGRTCVNAEVCTSTDDCLVDHLCIEGSCELEEEVCAECNDDEICEYDRNTLTFSCVDDRLCEPGARQCDGDTLIACNSEGTVENNVICSQGCDPETNRCNLAEGDACHFPFVAEHGSSYNVDWTIYTNVYEPSPSTGCVEGTDALSTTGTDVTFEIDVAPNEVARVIMTTPVNYGVMYMIDKCEDSFLNACVDPTGQQGEEVDDKYERNFWYFNENQDTETIYVVADTGPQASAGSADFEVEIVERICEPGIHQCADGTLEECNSFGTGFDAIHDCSLGCSEEPGDNGCAWHPHSTCDTPLDIIAEGQTYTGAINDFRADDPFDADACEERFSGSNSEFDGATAYFSVHLEEGERVTASLASTFDAGIWLTDICDRDEGQCFAAENQGSQTELLEYQSDTQRELLIVVQAIDGTTNFSGEFTLDVSIDLPLCLGAEPGDILGCFDGDPNDRLGFCPTTSEFATFYGCRGACEDGECVEPSGDRCLDPIVAEDGQVYSGSFADQSYTLNPGNDCLGSNTNAFGTDTIYQVEIGDQQVFSAELTSTSNNIGLYLLDDCPTAAATSISSLCVASNFPAKNLDLYFEEGGTYFLVVGSTSSGEDAEFDLTFEIDDGICLPGETVCNDDTGISITSFCEDNANELTPIETCAGACNEELDACGAPETISDRCNQAVDITRPSVLRDDFGRFNNRDPFVDTDCGTDGITMNGPEAYYRVQLAPLQGVRTTLDTSRNAALIMHQACSIDSDACSFHSVSNDGDTFKFYSPEGGTYWLAAKTFSSTSGAFELEFDFFEGDCVPTDDFCSVDDFGNSVAESCSDLGEKLTEECPHGCFDGDCLDRPGDFCHTAFDIDAGEMATFFAEDSEELSYLFEGNLAGFTNAYEPRDEEGKSCTGWDGKGAEVVFAFQGWADDLVTIDFDTDYDGALWITTDCTAAADRCVAGVDDVFGTGLESLSYTVESTQTHYIMADAAQAGASGDLSLNVTIEKGPRVLQPEIEITGADNLSWSLLVEQQDTAQFQIENLGELPLEWSLSNSASWLEITPEDGELDGFESIALTATATCPANPVTFETTLEITSNDAQQPSVSIPVTLDCAPVPGSMNVTVDGLPAGVNHSIAILLDGSYLRNLPQSGELSDLTPGQYTLVPSEVEVVVDDQKTTYNGDSVTFMVESGEESQATITYEGD